MNANYLGIFAKLIVQIPVDGGYEDGKMKVLRESDQHVAYFNFCNESKHHFSAAAFFSDCKHEWQPVKQGNIVALEYELAWQPCSAFTDCRLEFPIFLSALRRAKEALSSWNSNQSNLDASMDLLLVVPLNGIYLEKNLNFTSLQGSDSQATHILQSIEFIDIHLAIIGQQTEKSDTSCYEIVRWIYSSTSVPQFTNPRLNMTNQLIGQLNTNLVFSSMHKVPRYAVLIIQPQRQSIHRCCDLSFGTMLTYLESRIRLDGDSKTMRLRSVVCIESTISSCQESPRNVWRGSKGDTNRTLRFLNICRGFQDPKTGLLLIQLLGDHCGVQNKLVVRSIVEFLWNMKGNLNYFFSW